MSSYAFGKLLRELRQARGLRQQDVAYKLGVPVSRYVNWEHGSCPLFDRSELNVLASILSADVRTLEESLGPVGPTPVIYRPPEH